MNWLEFGASAIDTLAWPVAAVWIAFLLRDRLLNAIGQLTGIEGFGIKAVFERKASRVQEKVEVQVAEESPGEIDNSIRPEPSTEGQGDRILQPGTRHRPSRKIWPRGGGREQVEYRTGQPEDEGTADHEFAVEPGVVLTANNRRMQQLLGILHALKAGVLTPRGAVLDAWSRIEDGVRELHQLASGEVVEDARSVSISIGRMTHALIERGLVSDETFENIRSLSQLRYDASHAPGSVSEAAAKSYVSSAYGVLRILHEAFRDVVAVPPVSP